MANQQVAGGVLGVVVAFRDLAVWAVWRERYGERGEEGGGWGPRKDL